MEGKWIVTYDEYDRLMEQLEKSDSPVFFPSEEDIELMEKKITDEVIMFACYLEQKLKPSTVEEKYKIKMLKNFINTHVEFREK